MKFKEAFRLMEQGVKVKLPSWSGYWYWDADKESIIMHTKDGEELDIRETQRVEYTLANILSGTWQIADEKNCPELGGEATFSFGEAIKYLKRGMKVARKGWNGKKQYIQLATGISYKTADGDIVNCEHDAIGNMAVAFVGTSGVQMGWLASQADMLADDWVFAEQKGGDPYISHRQGIAEMKGCDDRLIDVTVRENELTVSGHAGYAAKGEDIVCAAVTALSITLFKSLTDLTEAKIEYDVQPGWVDIKYRDLSEKAKALIDSFFIGICLVADEFPGYIRIL